MDIEQDFFPEGQTGITLSEISEGWRLCREANVLIISSYTLKDESQWSDILSI